MQAETIPEETIPEVADVLITSGRRSLAQHFRDIGEVGECGFVGAMRIAVYDFLTKVLE